LVYGNLKSHTRAHFNGHFPGEPGLASGPHHSE